jgi:hypothetical protein
MECISCKLEINPQWAHAIDMNVCPFCGKNIMDDKLKKLFASLRETMEQLQVYPDQLNDWMLSNHNYIKTSSEKIIDYVSKDILVDLKKIKDDKDFQDRKKFTVKVKSENGTVEEVQAETLQSEEKTNDFFKRAEVIRGTNPSTPKDPTAPTSFQSPAEKTQHLKEMAKQIKRAGATGITSSGDSMVISAEMLENADPEAVAEFEQMVSGGEIASSLDVSEDDVPAGILAANTAFAKAKGGNSSANAADLLKLQQMQDRLKNSKAAFESGENRGGKGGGFSRSG